MQSQISIGGEPKSIIENLDRNIPNIILPSVNRDALIQEDKIEEMDKKEIISKLNSFEKQIDEILLNVNFIEKTFSNENRELIKLNKQFTKKSKDLSAIIDQFENMDEKRLVSEILFDELSSDDPQLIIKEC